MGLVFEDLSLEPGSLSLTEDGFAPVSILASLRIAPAGPDPLYRPLGATFPLGETLTVPAIPYFLWANREPGPMRVWIPLAAREE